MRTRMDLHRALRNVLGENGDVHVYYQPPEGMKLDYPAIVYHRNTTRQTYADNVPYFNRPMYTITVISKEVDGPIVDALLLWPKCSHNRHFKKDNLCHDTFELYL